MNKAFIILLMLSVLLLGAVMGMATYLQTHPRMVVTPQKVERIAAPCPAIKPVATKKIQTGAAQVIEPSVDIPESPSEIAIADLPLCAGHSYFEIGYACRSSDGARWEVYTKDGWKVYEAKP